MADSNPGAPDLSNMDQDNNVKILAQALVYARTGEAKYRNAVLDALVRVMGTEGGSTLPLGREAAAYALAADFIGLSTVDPNFDKGSFRPWLQSLLVVQLDGRTLRSTHEDRANNWGTHAGASRAAIAAYLGDRAELARTAQVFRGWLGDRAAFTGFSFGDFSWQPNPAAPVPVLPVGAKLGGVDIGGALPEEMRRGGPFKWPPAATDYPWGALEGAVLQAEILHRAGYDAYNWSDQAILRAVRFLFEQAKWRPAGNDQWVFWVVDYRYGTGYRQAAPVPPGKNFGWSDWLYGPGG
ncbi:MAG: alginate lyase family protein [Candidatus Limnocylindria bacterium]